MADEDPEPDGEESQTVDEEPPAADQGPPAKLSRAEVEASLDEIEDLPDTAEGTGTIAHGPGSLGAAGGGPGDATDPGMPNVARGPDTLEPDGWGSNAYLVAIEMVARLPDDVLLPEAAADTVPVVVEASIRQRVEKYVGMEFQDAKPQVSVLGFEETEEGVWMKLRVGIPPERFDAIGGHLDEIRAGALDTIETIFSEEGPND